MHSPNELTNPAFKQQYRKNRYDDSDWPEDEISSFWEKYMIIILSSYLFYSARSPMKANRITYPRKSSFPRSQLVSGTR